MNELIECPNPACAFHLSLYYDNSPPTPRMWLACTSCGYKSPFGFSEDHVIELHKLVTQSELISSPREKMAWEAHLMILSSSGNWDPEVNAERAFVQVDAFLARATKESKEE